jgi:IS30 family transposase
MNFNLVFERYIQFVNKQINDRPRKKLNYYSPYEIFSKFTA